ncbi:MAG: transposase [Xanthomonadaceae bacterium]|nr:transposase [Xanthomonadaceae bacterium]
MNAHSHRLRVGRYSALAETYLVTTATEGRVRLFRNPVNASIVSASIDFLSNRLVYSFAWVVMPDHIHWVLQPTESPLSTVMLRLKNWTGREINRALRRKGKPVWQSGYHERRLVSQKSLVQAVNYVANNPVVAGLARKPGEYQWVFVGDPGPEWNGRFE